LQFFNENNSQFQKEYSQVIKVVVVRNIMVWLRRHWGVAGFWAIKRQKRPYQHTRFEL
jgi:hypothetical protein